MTYTTEPPLRRSPFEKISKKVLLKATVGFAPGARRAKLRL